MLYSTFGTANGEPFTRLVNFP